MGASDLEEVFDPIVKQLPQLMKAVSPIIEKLPKIIVGQVLKTAGCGDSLGPDGEITQASRSDRGEADNKQAEEKAAQDSDAPKTPRTSGTNAIGYAPDAPENSADAKVEKAAGKQSTEANYVLGDSNSNNCPSGYKKIISKATCRSAAQGLGIKLGTWNSGETTNSNEPSGCFQNRNGQAFFNTDHGSADAQCRPMCTLQAAKEDSDPAET